MKKTNLVLAGALPDGVSSGAVVEVSPVEGNATPAVRAAVARLEDGGTLRFAKGEYYFFEEGAEDVFLASPGSSTGWKKAVFHLDGLKDVTIDGGGSSFVFHGKAFPFVAFPRDRMVECADGLVFTGVPVYDSPCLLTERSAIAG